MPTETLLTFTFDATVDATTVELLGSWDGFTNAYPLQPDRRRGIGRWTGCFRFQDIIFDGIELSAPRTGGLQQGGCYWYFFRLDERVDTYDDRLPTRADCPLLPEQSVNFVEVPEELDAVCVERPRSDSRLSAVMDLPAWKEHEYTLDPAERDQTCFPATHISKAAGLTHERLLSSRSSLPQSLAGLEHERQARDVVDTNILAEYQPYPRGLSTAGSGVSDMSVKPEPSQPPSFEQQRPDSRPIDQRRRTKSSDLANLGVMRWWRRAYKVHDRSLSSTSQRVQAKVPQEVWNDPCELLVASLQRYQAPLAT